eukprot:comp11795_c0_seq1/m.6405 comp11795_c0_seq1/g.6405  ORF comp11795_c0_seq1/g.6405 comp11795_c0_seq1/m.6405 type:complete len:143 (-) comp11795_c0_seq1:444-872(-)
MAQLDKEAISAAYEDVRDDKTETSWAVFVYDDAGKIMVGGKGSDYEEFLATLKDDCRAYGFVRIETGDELSKRAKFAFITWIGDSVSALKKAKVSTDKAEVKKVVQNFAAELLGSEKSDVTFNEVKTKVLKAGGANYGTGSR